MNSRHCITLAAQALTLVSLLTSVVDAASPAAQEASVGQWERFEAAVIHHKKYADPFAEVRLNVVYTRPNGETVSFWGFYDGEFTWKIRFMPDAVGTWKYQAQFSDGSAGTVGTFTCVESKTPGPVIADPENPIWFRHASGQQTLLRSLHVGDRFFAENWPASEHAAFLDWVQKRGYDTLSVASFFLNRDANNRGRGWRTPKLWPLDASEYRKAEAILDELARRKIVVFPFAGFFGRDAEWPREPAQQLRYIEYVLARFGPYWNLLLNVAGPEPLLRVQPYMTKDQVNQLGNDIRQRNPFPHLLTVHNQTGDDEFQGSEWISCVTLQGPKTNHPGKLSQGLLKNHHPKKPLYAQETLWSGNTYHIRGIGRDYSDDELRRNAFVLLFSAAAFNFADNTGDSSTGFSGTLNLLDCRLDRHDIIRFVWDTFQTLPYRKTKPRQDLVDRGFCLAEEGRTYLVYLPEAEPVTVQTRLGPFEVIWRNARDGNEQRLKEPVADCKNLRPPADGEWILQLLAK